MWFRLDDGFHGHPKVRRAGNGAVGLWVRCATYSAQYGLDGAVPTEVAEDYGTGREAAAVTRAALWVPSDDGYRIPDFLEYNPSAAEVAAGRITRLEAVEFGRRGGKARAAGAKRDERGHFLPTTLNGEAW